MSCAVLCYFGAWMCNTSSSVWWDEVTYRMQHGWQDHTTCWTRSHDMLDVCSFHQLLSTMKGCCKICQHNAKSNVCSEDNFLNEPSTAWSDCRTINLKRLDHISLSSSKLLVRTLLISLDKEIMEKVSSPHSLDAWVAASSRSAGNLIKQKCRPRYSALLRQEVSGTFLQGYATGDHKLKS